MTYVERLRSAIRGGNAHGTTAELIRFLADRLSTKGDNRNVDFLRAARERANMLEAVYSEPIPEKTSYDTGFSDGYAEGYAVKLLDVGAPFTPTGTADEVERVAAYLMTKCVTDKAEAIGLARGMINAARKEPPK